MKFVAMAAMACLSAAAPAWAEPSLAEPVHEVSFGKDVLPILSEHCFTCHGPDEAARSTELRFDQRESALADLGGYTAIVPGDPDESEAIRRIFSDDPYEVMPPPEAKMDLTPEAKQVLVDWVRSGADWESHWAFEPPRRPDVAAPLPEAIDTLVRSRLEREGLTPSPRADRATLARRVSLALTGLPPTPAKVEAFVADDSEDAYARFVDGLLDSDACAEWLALEWMDVGRYADSHGLHADGSRTSWPWRDWVINAFRDNLPYDQFLTWQIAGDLLPGATREQILATAFLRNHPMTGEGGVIDEEFRWNYVFDRVETTGTAVLGLTMQCARCHDHKFDPISQREYFEFAAFFNNVRELGMTGDDGDYSPLLALPDTQTENRQSALARAIRECDAEFDGLRESHARDALASGKQLEGVSPPTPHRHVAFEKMADQPLAAENNADGTPEEPTQSVDGLVFVTAKAPESFVDGVVGRAARIDGDYGYLELADTGLIDVADPLSLCVWVRPEPQPESATKSARVLAGTAGDKNQLWRGWEFYLDTDERLALSLISTMPSEKILVKTETAVAFDRWTHVGFSYDGSGRASGVRLYVDGRPATTRVMDDHLPRSILPVEYKPGYPADPARHVQLGRSHRKFTGDNGVYLGAFDELRVYDTRLTDAEIAAVYDDESPAAAPSAIDDLTVRQLREHDLVRNNETYASVDRDRRSLLAMATELLSGVPHVMVVEETPGLRQTRVLKRGEYTQPGEVVEPDAPAVVGGFPEDLPRNRLGLARWMFSDDNPLAARVAVNRYWQFLFSVGLVETPQDFGLQGSRPTQPELLDLLAVEFRESDWDLRRLLRSIVLSETYQQSSVAVRPTPVAAEPNGNQTASASPASVDPGNRLLWRGPTRRMKAEALRDSALAASGLLVRKTGGPSVRPYQPEGLWIEKSNFSQELLRYVPGEGDSLYRRSMYTFLRRTSPPPSMSTFDAPNRSTCVVQREATNTPLQALVLLNDPQFVEAARVLAERVALAEDAPDEQIAEVFGRLAGRTPSAAEADALSDFYEASRVRYEASPEAAAKLLSVGAHERLTGDEHADADVAALTLVASTVMNYDAFYMER
ncbi:MAG: DUF1553 domain-containing protein [Planctomycetota bacterium]